MEPRELKKYYISGSLDTTMLHIKTSHHTFCLYQKCHMSHNSRSSALHSQVIYHFVKSNNSNYSTNLYFASITSFVFYAKYAMFLYKSKIFELNC